MAANRKLKVNVLAGKSLIAKNGNKSDPYCEVTVLDDAGNKLGKTLYTKVIKGDLNPEWNQLLEFPVPSTFSGLKLRCWDKHRFRADKFMGQLTIKFNTSLLQSTEKLDQWFDLSKRKAGEVVSGQIHIQIQYGDLKDVTPSSSTGSTTNIAKDRSATIIGENPPTELKVSHNFSSEKTNEKLKTSAVVVVEEDEENDDANTKDEEYEKVRDGPSTAALEPLVKGDKDIQLTNKNLEVTNNSTDYYKVGYAKSNVAINGGKWYYEVRIQVTGQIQIGWCNTNYNPKTNTGDIWVFDGSRQQKLKNGASSYYGEYWSTGDIIGVSVDVDAKSIQYWRNGKDLGVAFTDVTVGGGRLVPVIGLVKRCKVQVNFGKDPLAFPQSSFNILHCFLSEKEIEQLAKLYSKYKEIGNEEARKENDKAEMKESIHGHGLLAFQTDLGATDDDDPTMLIIAWKLKCETLWEISREEFMNGFTINGCASLEKINSKVKEWQNELKDTTHFRSFYNFVFDYLKEDKKILLTEEALMAWKIVLKERPWPLFVDFEEFLKDEDKKSISRDAWQQLWHFMNTYPKSLKEYDTMSSWPIVFDEFVEWMEAKGRKNK